MTIFFRTDKSTNFEQIISNPTVRPHEKIGTVFSHVLEKLKTTGHEMADIPKLLQHLGVHPNDEEAVDEMASLLESLGDGTFKITPTVNSGIYFVQKAASSKKETVFEDVAVFKIGHKRAAMELAARFLAKELGLKEHMIPGMFCAVENPPILKTHPSSTEEQETVEELWSGKEKIFIPPSKKPEKTQTSKKTKEDDMLQFSFNPELDFIDSPSSDEEKNHSEDDFLYRGRPLTRSKFDRNEDSSSEESADESTDKIVRSAPLYVTRNRLVDSDEEEEDIFRFDDLKLKAKEKTSLGKEKKSDLKAAHKTASAVVGIVQPFLADRKKASVYEFTKMTCLALAIGLRDGKTDGYKGAELYDVEDSFPKRIDPPWTPGVIEKHPSAIDLPYLDKDERTTAPLTQKEVAELATIVNNWNITEIIGKLKKLKIQYYDEAAEKMRPGATGRDSGNNNVKVMQGTKHRINGQLNHLNKLNPKYRILLPDQLDACNTRLQRIRDFILTSARQQKTFSTKDLVHAVDPWGEIFHEALLASPLPRKADQIIRSQGVYHLSGRQSPEELRLHIPVAQYSKRGTVTSNTPSPDLSDGKISPDIDEQTAKHTHPQPILPSDKDK